MVEETALRLHLTGTDQRKLQTTHDRTHILPDEILCFNERRSTRGLGSGKKRPLLEIPSTI